MAAIAKHTREEIASAVGSGRCTIESITLYAGTPRRQRYYVGEVEQPSNWKYIIRKKTEAGDFAVAMFVDADLAQDFLLGLREF